LLDPRYCDHLVLLTRIAVLNAGKIAPVLRAVVIGEQHRRQEPQARIRKSLNDGEQICLRKGVCSQQNGNAYSPEGIGDGEQIPSGKPISRSQSVGVFGALSSCHSS
jgi:hypothetical protein